MYFLFAALFSVTCFSQIDPGDGSSGPCTEAIFSSAGTYNCTTLTVNTSVNASFDPLPFIIKVQGDVNINATISLNGLNGTYGDPAAGGAGGPGATNGGTYDSFVGPGNGGGVNGGLAPLTDTACGAGGGGGSFYTLGSSGTSCPSGSNPGALAGASTTDPFMTFTGGFGGGSGADGPASTAASGGGGGGALRIMAGGSINIYANISARGGNGGSVPGLQNGGPGGGGSGGVIWIQTLDQITNNGTIDVSGGPGGSSDLGTRGGNGGNGVFRLEDADGVISGTGSGTSGSASKLTSSISCGTVKMNDQNTLPQFVLGFSLIALFQLLIGKLKRLRYSQAKA